MMPKMMMKKKKKRKLRVPKLVEERARVLEKEQLPKVLEMIVKIMMKKRRNQSKRKLKRRNNLKERGRKLYPLIHFAMKKELYFLRAITHTAAILSKAQNFMLSN